ncbi:NAD(P)/FAD-dependent oxidoreductase [Candidatus Woesearchaeota archaeon]|nr:NAD(P)/FAD-dependent oxidoreductase [Candidatus Woesearchaeota archaeon]
MDSLQTPVQQSAKTQSTTIQSMPAQPALTAKKSVVIAGSGFGGLRVAEKLRKNCGEAIEIVVIDSADCHTFVPALYSVATGETSAQAVCEPLSVIYIRKGIKYIQEKIVDIDVKKKIVSTKKDKRLNKNNKAANTIPYDFLVLALGSEVNFYDIKGIQKNAFALKTKENAAAIYEHLQDVITSMANKDKQLHRLVILGGGVTGVELACELKDHLDNVCRQNSIPREKFSVMIIQALEHLVPGFPANVQKFCEHYMAEHGIELRLNSPVVQAKNQLLVLKSGEIIKADTVIWAGGIKANKLLNKIKIEQDDYGIKVNSYLQSVSDQNIYAVGDCMNYSDQKTGKRALKTAQNALMQAVIVAENINRAANEKNIFKSYKPKETPVLISLGKKMGLFVWKSFWFRGYWMMKMKDYIEKEYMWKIRL